MEKQRLFIISALAVVCYLLILQWNQDYGHQPSSAQIPTEAPATVTTQSIPENLDLPTNLSTPSNPTSSTVDDLPTSNVQPIVVAPVANTALIRVETDTLDVLIDPKGGDIKKAALKAYPKALDRPNDPFLLLESGGGRTYIAQSGLVGLNGPDASPNGRPFYESKRSHYEIGSGEDLKVDLAFVTPEGVEITKRFIFTRGSYLVNVEYLINNQTSEPWQATFFAQLKRDNSQDPSSSPSMGMSSFLGVATTNNETRYEKIGFDDIQEDAYKSVQTGGWVAIIQHYFVSAWIPESTQQYTYETRVNASRENIAGLVSAAFNVAPGSSAKTGAGLYVGPKIQKRLEAVAPNLELTVDYGWLWFIAQPLYAFLSFFQSGHLSIFGFEMDLGAGVANWGWAIILLTIMIKLIFFRLSATSYRSMANMRRVGPDLQRLKERYGDNRQQMSMKMMELYKKEKINPLGGCLPILVQMPVFIALYWVLFESVELRHAPFILWLNDLSVMDPWFVLPILMGVTMFIQQSLNPEPPDPMQAKVMKMMPIIFTFFFLFFPAGLVLYWLVNNILSITQQWIITRQIEKAAEVSAKAK